MYGMIKGSNILDTLLLEPNKGFVLKDIHAARTFEAYQQLNQPVLLNEVHQLYNTLEKDLSALHDTKRIVRIVFSANQLSFTYSLTPFLELSIPLRLQIVSSVKATSGLGLQNYKWEQRDFWSIALTKKLEKADDIVSVNEKNHVVETSRFNLFFFSQKEGVVFTPPLESGCINGVYRRYLLQKKTFEVPNLEHYPLQEKSISVDDVTQYQVFVANSVRGVLPSVLLSE